ncbi:putative inactive purple acid phosphatase 27 [Nicotiana attenuata]|uniref:Inactive purple acid phosphatase 27 n=1 Tax=Nicotiana attenuata TaxID=49451 RepID=A0A1J6JCH5_NICAT|nr:putative inactive purple acid phosphatase 27 [Nicotiana attenuata]
MRGIFPLCLSGENMNIFLIFLCAKTFRDKVGTGSLYVTPDSGGECGVPYETYFQMPTAAKDKPWYSIEQGSVHFTVISTEHNWSHNSEQYEWMRKDMVSVD